MPTKLDPHRSLTDLLSERGLTHRTPLAAYLMRSRYVREIIDQCGRRVFLGDAGEVYAWLRAGLPAQGVQ